MSRATRPQRHVRGADRERLGRALPWLDRLCRLGGPASLIMSASERAARALGTRPAIVRRVLLGRVVSARAAVRLLRAA